MASKTSAGDLQLFTCGISEKNEKNGEKQFGKKLKEIERN
jgi:hypothetical protein